MFSCGNLLMIDSTRKQNSRASQLLNLHSGCGQVRAGNGVQRGREMY